MAAPLSIVFMGTPAFAATALDALMRAGHTITAVYTQPPRPAGRGYEVQKSAVHLYAEAHRLPVFTPKSLKKDADARAVFAGHKADVAVVAAYGLILPMEILNAPTHGCINIHASLLPRWRGAAPIQRAIMAGDVETGICIMQMDEGLDTGPVLLRDALPITAQTTAPQLHDDLARMGGLLIVEAMASIGTLLPQTQAQAGTTYAHMLKKDDGRIDWNQDAVTIERQLRALTPWPGVWCLLPNGGRLKVLEAQVAEGKGTPGTVLDSGVTIACGNGSALRLTCLQPENKKPMSGRDAVNGGLLQQGDVLQ